MMLKDLAKIIAGGEWFEFSEPLPDDDPEDFNSDAYAKARLILKALREPSEAMVEAGAVDLREAGLDIVPDRFAASSFTAMIDALMEGK